MFWLMLAFTVVAGVVGAGLFFVVLYRAVSNAFDWIVLTFGNRDVVGHREPTTGCAGDGRRTHSEGG